MAKTATIPHIHVRLLQSIMPIRCTHVRPVKGQSIVGSKALKDPVYAFVRNRNRNRSLTEKRGKWDYNLVPNVSKTKDQDCCFTANVRCRVGMRYQ